MKTVKLNDICLKITDGSHFSPKSDGNGSFPYVTVRDISNDVIDFENCKLISKESYQDLVNNGCKPDLGDLLFSKDGTVGKVSLVNFEKDFVVLSSLAIIRPDQSVILPEYLFHILKSPYFLNQAVGRKSGTAIRRIILRDLKNIEFVIEEDLEEQRKIVARLDAAFEKISAAEVLMRRNLDNVSALQKSILHKYLSTSDTTSKLADVCQEIFAGGDVVKSRTSKTITEKFTVPVYTNGEKNNGLYGFTDMIRVNKPSVTVSARGTIGFSAVRKEPFYPAVRLIVLTPDTSKLDVEYLDYAIKTLTIDNTGTSIPQLTVPMIKEYSVSLPSIDTQRKIVGILNAANEKISKLELKYTEKLTKLAGLRQSLLAEAFSTTNTV